MSNDEKEPKGTPEGEPEEELRLGEDPQPLKAGSEGFSGLKPSRDLASGLRGMGAIRREMEERMEALRELAPPPIEPGRAIHDTIVEGQRRSAERAAERLEREKRQLAVSEAQQEALSRMADEGPRAARRQWAIIIVAGAGVLVGLAGVLWTVFG